MLYCLKLNQNGGVAIVVLYFSFRDRMVGENPKEIIK